MRNTCCLATVLVGLTSKYQKTMLYEFQKWTEKMESSVTDTTLEELTSEMKGKAPMDPTPPHLTCSPAPH